MPLTRRGVKEAGEEGEEETLGLLAGAAGALHSLEAADDVAYRQPRPRPSPGRVSSK